MNKEHDIVLSGKYCTPDKNEERLLFIDLYKYDDVNDLFIFNYKYSDWNVGNGGYFIYKQNKTFFTFDIGNLNNIYHYDRIKLGYDLHEVPTYFRYNSYSQSDITSAIENFIVNNILLKN